jgi:hypothetical protein
MWTYPEQARRPHFSTDTGGCEAGRQRRPNFESHCLDVGAHGGFVEARNIEQCRDGADGAKINK